MTSVRAIIEQAERDRVAVIDEPKKRVAPRVAPLPPLHMAELVDWFFNEGQSLFEKSVTGAILDAARLGDYTSHPCAKCKGSGIAGDVAAMIATVVNWKEQDRHPLETRINETFVDCAICGGSGVIERRVRSHVQKYETEAPFYPIDPLDVQLSKKQEMGLKSPPDDKKLTRYAIVCRRLRFLPESTSKTVAAGYGPWGRSWSETSRGREWAVIPLTQSGKALLLSPGLTSRAKDKGVADALDTLGDMADSGSLANDSGKLLRKAIKEARDLLAAAILDWNRIFCEGDL